MKRTGQVADFDEAFGSAFRQKEYDLKACHWRIHLGGAKSL